MLGKILLGLVILYTKIKLQKTIEGESKGNNFPDDGTTKLNLCIFKIDRSIFKAENEKTIYFVKLQILSQKCRHRL